MNQDDASEEEESGSGAASILGYEYQIDVSVWLALDLVVLSRWAETMVLEPATQEDLEATLAYSEPGRLVNRVSMTSYTLIVQAKRRSGDAWTPTTLKTLLTHGGEKRVSAADRLKKANCRYLLVTSAGVNGDARKLVRRRVGAWPQPGVMPSAIRKGIDHDISGRVAVIANQDDERLRLDIDRLLIEGCHIPKAQLEDCRNRLRQDARGRIAGAAGGHWSRDQLEDVIRRHEGYLANSPELEHYVHPTNWGDLRAVMARESAGIIIGQSGTGKTLATKKLYDELRKEIPGLTRVPIRSGPSQLRDDVTLGPVLFDIEDPWGKIAFDRENNPWRFRVAEALSGARPERMVIATSRLDVAKASDEYSKVQRWTVALEAENYQARERRRLYESRIESLPSELQPLARGSRNKVLDELATPLEIQKFFDALRTQDRAGLINPPVYVAEAIKRAHQNSIEQTVIEQIESRGDVRAAAVIWALLTANGTIEPAMLAEIDDRLADIDAAMGEGASPLVNFFVAARNLRQSDEGALAYYHPRVEAGIERTLKDHRQLVRQTLRRLVDLLVSGSLPDTGTAVRIMAHAADQFRILLSDDASAKIDAWLEERLVEGADFQPHLELAARAGSKASNVAEIARFLLNRRGESLPDLTTWAKPKLSTVWYSARKSDPSTKSVLENFIRTILPYDRIYYPEDFADELTQLSSGLTSAFLEAADTAVHFGYIESDEAISRGALADIGGFERIVDMAVDVLTPTPKDLQDSAEKRLDIINGVYSEDYVEYLQHNDDGYTADQFLVAYLERVREAIGWQHIVQHRHANWLRPYWLRILVTDARQGRFDDQEFASAFAAGFGTKDEDDLWVVLLKRWDSRYRLSLEDRLRNGSPDVNIERAALTCLIEHDIQSFPRIVAELIGQRAVSRVIEIGRGVAYLLGGGSRDGEKHIAAAAAAAAQLPDPYGDIVAAEVALEGDKIPVLSTVARDVLTTTADAGRQVRSLRLLLDASVGLLVEEDVTWALVTEDDPDTAVLAIKIAIHREMNAQVEAALDHRFAHVAALALKAVATPLAAPLPERVLALAFHRASPVRRALVELLKTKPHTDHQATLLKLASDRWTANGIGWGNESHDYPIAREAVDALLLLKPLGDEAGKALFNIATDTSDPKLRRAVFQLMAESGVASQKRLFDLAVRPGRTSVRVLAAEALHRAGETLGKRVINAISSPLVATRYAPVATILAALLGRRADVSAIRAVAEDLAANAKRKVLLLPIVWHLKDRDRRVAEEIVAMLPAGHRAVAWVLRSAPSKIDDLDFSDLGDHDACAEVLNYMKARTGKPERKTEGQRR
ncbi:hypothetical protein [Inquilinus ginsengisoli]|uniref:nSTAND3 domain-containing NTPase n=1 Tax=Inquilinus ginsengisoli TaxID=363840 RepID=UPI003D1C3F58